MLKKSIHIAITVLALLLASVPAGAQNHVRRAMEKARERQEAMARKQVNEEQANTQGAGYLRMVVENGDTTYLDKIPPIWILGKRGAQSEKAWRDYYRLVWRFARVYPYAEGAADVQRQVDSVLSANNYGAIKKERLISDVQKQLFKSYEGAFRQMSISQGALLMKLIDRETGMSSYSIIKEYKSGAAAGFWQVVAKMFDNDLKSQYDPEGADRDIEMLVQAWKAGEFPALYWSVFWENPPQITISKIRI